MMRILFFFLLVPALCFGQNKKALRHFWDIPWGVPIERAEAIFQERGFTSTREENSLITRARYEGEEALIILLFNKANRFCSGNVVYSGTSDTAIPKYKNYRLVLFRRYGVPDTAVEYYASPYVEGDGKEIEAITTENALYLTEWVFGDSCLASLQILRSLDVCLSFTNPVYVDAGSR